MAAARRAAAIVSGLHGYTESVMQLTSSTNIITCIFAVALCLINALVWAFVSDMPLVGIAWVGAAGVCLKAQTWSRQ